MLRTFCIFIANHMSHLKLRFSLMKKICGKSKLVSQVGTHISDRGIGDSLLSSWHLCPFYSTPVTQLSMRCLCWMEHYLIDEKHSVLYINMNIS